MTEIGIANTNDCGYATYLPQDHPAQLSNPIIDLVEIWQNASLQQLPRKFQELSQRHLDQHQEFGSAPSEQPAIPFYCFHVNWGGIGDDPFMESVMYARVVRTDVAPLTYTADLETDRGVRRSSLAFDHSGLVITKRDVTGGADPSFLNKTRTFYQATEWRRSPSP